MTREESRQETLIKIKRASSGKEIKDAIINHFRQFTDLKEKKVVEVQEISQDNLTLDDAVRIFDGKVPGII